MPDRSGRRPGELGLPADGLRWRALEVGPGGVPPEEVRPMGPGAPWGSGIAPPVGPAGPMGPPVVGMQPLPPSPSQHGPADPWLTGAPPPAPARSRRILGLVVLAAVVVLVVGLALWSRSSSGAAAQVVPGDCLSREESGDYRIADCGSAEASLRVNGRLDAAAGSQDCDEVPSDGALRTETGVLCLDFLLARGDCVQLNGADLGRADCPAPGRSADGIQRVLDVLPDTQDTGSCPRGTEQVLVHAAVPEVVCLGAA